jgi:hypothetical protein
MEIDCKDKRYGGRVQVFDPWYFDCYLDNTAGREEIRTGRARSEVSVWNVFSHGEKEVPRFVMVGTDHQQAFGFIFCFVFF